MHLDLSKMLFPALPPPPSTPAHKVEIPGKKNDSSSTSLSRSEVPTREFRGKIENFEQNRISLESKKTSAVGGHRAKLELPTTASPAPATQVFKNVQREKAVAVKIAGNQKKIDDLVRELKPINDPVARQAIIQKIQILANEIKAWDIDAKVFIQFAQGKAKVVSADFHTMDLNAFAKDKKIKAANDKIDFKAYYTPVDKGKEAEIRDEVNTAIAIENELKKFVADGEETYIASSLKEMPKEDQKGDHYTVETDKALSDLDHSVHEKYLKFPDSGRIGLNILKGMNNLHKAGYVHGDPKGDNVLMVKKKGQIIAQMTDLGKTRKMKEGEKGINVGNPRYAAPEGGTSQRAEVYSTALMMIHALEGELLNPETENGKMLINEKTENKDASVSKTDASVSFEKDKSVTVGEKRLGIERFVVLNKNCPQTENTSLRGKVRIIGREISQFIGLSNSYPNAEKEVHKYIDALVKGLSEKAPSAAEENQIKRLGQLLKEMTRSDLDGPNARTKSLEDALKNYEAIMTPRREPAKRPNQPSAPPTLPPLPAAPPLPPRRAAPPNGGNTSL